MSQRYERASALRRFISYILDILIGAAAFTPVFIWYLRGLFSERSGVYLLGYGPLLVYFCILCRFLYLTILWKTGGTAAERLVGIRVIHRNGEPLSLVRCALRALTLPLDVLSLGCVYIPFPHEGLHDRMSDSTVRMRH